MNIILNYIYIFGFTLYINGIKYNKSDNHIFLKNFLTNVFFQTLVWWLITYSLSNNYVESSIIGNLKNPIINIDSNEIKVWLSGLFVNTLNYGIISNYICDYNLKIFNFLISAINMFLIIPFQIYWISDKGFLNDFVDYGFGFNYISCGVVIFLYKYFILKKEKVKNNVKFNNINDIFVSIIIIFIFSGNFLYNVILEETDYNLLIMNIILSNAGSYITYTFFSTIFCLKKNDNIKYFVNTFIVNIIGITPICGHTTLVYSFLIGIIINSIYLIITYIFNNINSHSNYIFLYTFSTFLAHIFVGIFDNTKGYIQTNNVDLIISQLKGSSIIFLHSFLIYLIIFIIFYKFKNYLKINQNTIIEEKKTYEDINSIVEDINNLNNNVKKNKDIILNVISEVENIQNNKIMNDIINNEKNTDMKLFEDLEKFINVV